MKKTLFILLPLLLIVGCSKPVEESTLINKDGLMFLPDSDSPYSGEVYFNYDTGEKLYTGRYENGLLIEYSYLKKDGNVKTPINDETLIEKDKLIYDPNYDEPYNGEVVMYYDTGEKEYQGTYENGLLVQYSYLNKDGTVKEPINGETLIDRSGLFYEVNGQKPYTGDVFELHKDGSRKSTGSLKGGSYNGLIIGWYENGQKEGEVTFKDGILDGLTTGWYENGQKRFEETYKDGELDGLVTTWYENGQKEVEGTFKDGKLDGLGTSWYENGQKEVEGTYKDDKKDGLWTYWYENGQKQTEETYKHDELISSKSRNKDGSIIKNVCISTDFGIMILELYPEVASKHVESFIQHVKNGYYNGTTFHRVIPGFVIQGGDPNSRDNNRDDDGQGGHAARYFGHGDENVAASWTLPAEFNERPHITGALSMARAQENNSAGSQFFICAAPVHRLDNRYTVFGQVISGLEVIQKIVNVPRDRLDNPSDKIEMEIDFCEK